MSEKFSKPSDFSKGLTTPDDLPKSGRPLIPAVAEIAGGAALLVGRHRSAGAQIQPRGVPNLAIFSSTTCRCTMSTRWMELVTVRTSLVR